MNTYFWPYDPRNHYTTLVAEYLEKNGITVVNKGRTNKAKDFIYSIWEVPIKKIKIIHLNWIEMCASKRTLKCKIAEVFVTVWLNLMRLYGAKIIWTVHNKTAHDNPLDEKNTRRFYKKMLGYTSLVMVHCKETKDMLVDEYGYPSEKIFQVPHGAYDDETAEPTEWKKANQVDDRKMVLLTFGNIVPYKNVPLLAKVCKELGTESNLQLVIAGAIPQRYEELRDEIQPYVDGTDTIFDERFLPDEEMKDLFAHCDCVVLPYERESMFNSGVAVMAFSKGLPVIVSNFGAIKEINDRSFVWAYDFDSPEENEQNLKDTIIKVRKKYFDSREKFEQIKRDAYNYAHDEISWDNICKVISRKYSELIKDK